jgi:serine/threonine protein kinase
LWRGLQLIADGLQLLHDQNILHRNLRAETVLFNPQLGPRSFRLGGFEWSIRLGQLPPDVPTSGWPTPPEFFFEPATGYRRETDWYAFGMLAARCLLNLEPAAQLPLRERHARVLREMDKATARQLSDLERTYVQRLIDEDPSSRLTRGCEVRTTLKEIIANLDRGSTTGTEDRPLVVVINPASASDLIDRAQALGFIPNPEQPHEAFSPGSLVHVTNLTSFMQEDLAEARLYAVPKQRFYVLAGRRMTILLLPYRVHRSADEPARDHLELSLR